jgi:hypothetical protein
MLGQLILRSYHRATYLESSSFVWCHNLAACLCFINILTFMLLLHIAVKGQHHKQYNAGKRHET